MIQANFSAFYIP